MLLQATLLLWGQDPRDTLTDTGFTDGEIAAGSKNNALQFTYIAHTFGDDPSTLGIVETTFEATHRHGWWSGPYIVCRLGSV